MSAAPPDVSLDLLLGAAQAGSRDELLFTIVNRSVAQTPYDRASAWDLCGRPTLLALSGNATPDQRAPFAAAWSGLIRDMKNRNAGGILEAKLFSAPAAFEQVGETTGGLSAVWCVLPERRVGFLFERWGDMPFRTEEAGALGRLVRAYGLAWKSRGRSVGGRRVLRSLLWLVFLAAAAAAMALVRVPLRVVATCEVAARNPLLVSAPMEGVIDEVFVAPGSGVKKGDDIAAYDSRLMEEELKVTRRQVEVVEAQLASARARAFSDVRLRGDVALLEARLEQELARLDALEVRFSRRLVSAPADGMVQLDDARAWRGRPVSTGQAILWLVDPDDTRVKLWLPQDDRIDFDMARPVHIHLHALGGEGRTARLTYVSSFAQPGPDGAYYFPAEAEWEKSGGQPPLGLRGTASIYGQETSLGYWLFRRPLAWFRRWAGV